MATWKSESRKLVEGYAMSVKVKEWLKLLGIEPTHEERLNIDREIEFVTGLACDEGVSQLTEKKEQQAFYNSRGDPCVSESHRNNSTHRVSVMWPTSTIVAFTEKQYVEEC